jgi:hypothetical protein
MASLIIQKAVCNMLLLQSREQWLRHRPLRVSVQALQAAKCSACLEAHAQAGEKLAAYGINQGPEALDQQLNGCRGSVGRD